MLLWKPQTNTGGARNPLKVVLSEGVTLPLRQFGKTD